MPPWLRHCTRLSGSVAGMLNVLDKTSIARDPATPMKHAVTSLAAWPAAGAVAPPTTHPLTRVFSARGRVAASTADAVVAERCVRVAECWRVLVENEISARSLTLRRIDRYQR